MLIKKISNKFLSEKINNSINYFFIEKNNNRKINYKILDFIKIHS